MQQNEAAILAVGAELLSGQIVNTNAAWLASRLFALGIDVQRHLTVDDQHEAITGGLAELCRTAGIVLITGGLGPTSDDITRQAVAAWSGDELVFDQASWDRIVGFFSRLTRTVPENNRQQCYFPRGARILENRAGTANGFMVEAHGRQVWVLPGPSREVDVLWQDHLLAAFQHRLAPEQRQVLKLWRTIGRGESHLAELVEPIVAQHGANGVTVAYRAHAPYVELKVRYPQSSAAFRQALVGKLDEALQPWLYERDQEDLPALLIAKLRSMGVVDFYDGATCGHLLELLGPQLRDQLPVPAEVSLVTSWEQHDTPAAFVEEALAATAGSDATLACAGFDHTGLWAYGCRIGDRSTVVERPSPYRGEGMRARNLKAVAALAVKGWYEALSAPD